MPTDRYKKEIISSFEYYARKIKSPKTENYLRFKPVDMGYPHIEIQENGEFHYVTTEKGAEIERRTTTSVDELMYWIFEPLISEIAFKFAAENKLNGTDSRKIAFPKILELLEYLNPKWRLNKEIYINKTIYNSPYLD